MRNRSGQVFRRRPPDPGRPKPAANPRPACAGSAAQPSSHRETVGSSVRGPHSSASARRTWMQRSAEPARKTSSAACRVHEIKHHFERERECCSLSRNNTIPLSVAAACSSKLKVQQKRFAQRESPRPVDARAAERAHADTSCVPPDFHRRTARRSPWCSRWAFADQRQRTCDQICDGLLRRLLLQSTFIDQE